MDNNQPNATNAAIIEQIATTIATNPRYGVIVGYLYHNDEDTLPDVRFITERALYDYGTLENIREIWSEYDFLPASEAPQAPPEHTPW